MTYASQELSTYGGAPVELYRFTRGITNIYNTNSDRDVPVGPVVYTRGWPLSRTEPEMSDETSRSSIKITTASTHPVAQMFIAGAPSEPIWVSIFRYHVGSTDSILLWQGKLRGVTWNASAGEATFECDPVEKVIGKGGFRQTYGPHCHKKLYSARCGVPEANFTTDFVVSGISTNNLTITATAFATKPDQYFRLGELYFPSYSTRVAVLSHVGQNIQIKQPVLGLLVGAAGRACAGCDHCYKLDATTFGTCKTRFNNLVNFGGWPFVPKKNPYAVSIEG